MFEKLALETLLIVISQILGGDVFSKINDMVRDFFDSAFDNMPGSEKFDKVMEAIGPIVSGAAIFFAKAAIEIVGDIETVNGKISVTNTLVKGSITAVNGKILVLDHSVVSGDIVIKKSKRNNLFLRWR